MADGTGTTTTDTTTATGTDTKAAETTQATETKAAETTQATEAKGAEEIKAADKTEAGKEADKTAETKAEAEPVDYSKVISEAKMPEGVVIDEGLAKAGGEIFAKHKIPAEAAKEFVDFFAQQQKAGAEGNAKAFANQVKTWGVEAEKTTTPEERGAAKEAALKVFGKDEVALLETFGITNRAGFIKSLAKVASVLKDDRFVRGDAGGTNVGDARSMYPKSNMNP